MENVNLFLRKQKQANNRNKPATTWISSNLTIDNNLINPFLSYQTIHVIMDVASEIVNKKTNINVSPCVQMLFPFIFFEFRFKNKNALHSRRLRKYWKLRIN